MQTCFIEFIPQKPLPYRSLYLDLIGDKEKVINDIKNLLASLINVNARQKTIAFDKKSQPISRASDKTIYERITELRAQKLSYRTSQLAANYSSDDLMKATEGLAIQLQNAGVNFLQKGVINIENFATIFYDNEGCITRSEPEQSINGLKALELIAGFCAQDFGLIIDTRAELIYLYGSARFEKTPKHIDHGYDYFVGENFLEWHRRIPTWGHDLASLFEQLYFAFQAHLLDLLIVDLKGRNLYTNGELIVRRYERDYALPLCTNDGNIIGLTVFADSFFKNINDELRPFFGGKILAIESAMEFNDHFKVIKHAAFKHHPFGMRQQDGSPKEQINS